MAEIEEIKYERVDDVPLLIGLAMKLRLPEIIDGQTGQHGNHQGLSKGWLATIWIGYILSAGDHRKSYVREWVWSKRSMLEKLIGQELRWEDFSDDRLGIVLKWLSDEQIWEQVERELWHRTIEAYEVKLNGIRLDSTSSYGYHTPDEEGIMQFGHSKDHRPDLVQLKLMAAAAQPSGHLIGSDVCPGQSADDPLYEPMINRVREIVGRTGLLYSGDSKMAALPTRANLVAAGDFYQMPLPLTGQTGQLFEMWVKAVVEGTQSVELLWADTKLLGYGYEFERAMNFEYGQHSVQWSERVQVVRSLSLAQAQTQTLEKRLSQAAAALRHLTPDPGPGRSQVQDEQQLQMAITSILKQYKVTDLLLVSWQREEQRLETYIGPGRPGPNRKKQTSLKIRYVITAVHRNETAIAAQQYRFGWLLYVTNLPTVITIAHCLIHYRGGYCLERDFHLLKDVPLGLSPLFVRNDDQISGLTHLLTLALRLLTLLESQVRLQLANRGLSLSGLYPDQPNRTTDNPTAKRMLQAISRSQITRSRFQIASLSYSHLSPLPDFLLTILALLGLSSSLYSRLTHDST